MKLTPFLLSIALLTFFNTVKAQNIIKCRQCEGNKKVKEYLSPYACPKCDYWTDDQRRFNICTYCRNTQVNPNRKYRVIVCDVCKGSGRDVKKENRLKEFGNNEFLISSKSNKKVLVNGLQVNAGDMIFRVKNGDDEINLSYSEAVRACNSLGSGWRLPTLIEMNQLFNAYLNGQKDLDFALEHNRSDEFAYRYWTSTQRVYKCKVEKEAFNQAVCVTDFIHPLNNACYNCPEYNFINRKDYENKARLKCVNATTVN
jgi:hypothetical protein